MRGRPADGEEAVFARWFDAQGAVSETHTFASVWTEAGRIAHELRHSWGLAKGDRAVLCYGFGLDFFAAFMGCLRAGVLAVPVCESGQRGGDGGGSFFAQSCFLRRCLVGAHDNRVCVRERAAVYPVRTGQRHVFMSKSAR